LAKPLPDDARVRAWKKAKSDFEWFCKTFVRIKPKRGGIVPLIFNDAQRIIWDSFQKQMNLQGYIRAVIVKGRQQGCSTFIQAYLCWRVFFVGGQNALTIAHEMEMASQIFEKIELIYDELPEDMRPPMRQTRQGRKLQLDKPLRGMLYVESSEKRYAGRSGTWRHVHCSELPAWADPPTTMLGLLEVVPSGDDAAGTSIIVESTARGIGDYFHDLWLSAADPESEWQQIFVPWYKTKEYRRKRNAIDPPLDPIERKRRAAYGLDDAQLLWYRDRTSRPEGQFIQQEYPDTAEDAFLHGGVSFFGADDLAFIKEMVVPPAKTGVFEVVGGRARLTQRSNGSWWLWRYPVNGHSYVIFCDPSSGKGKDNTAICVLDADEMEVVATFRGKIEPGEAAVEMLRMGLCYRGATLCPETNNHGEVVIVKLLERLQALPDVPARPSIYRYRSENSVYGSQKSEWGLRTTTKTRPLILGKLLEVVRNRTLKLYCSRTFDEMAAFHYTNDSTSRAEAVTGARDDMVIALGGAALVSKDSTPQAELTYWVDRSRVPISASIGY